MASPAEPCHPNLSSCRFETPICRFEIRNPTRHQATRFYKGPELLLDIRDYDYSLDLWGVGCMMAALMFKKQVRGEEQVEWLCCLLGGQG